MRTYKFVGSITKLSPETAFRLKIITSIFLLTSATGLGLAPTGDGDSSFLPSPVRSVSTVPANGDINPYGVVFIPENFQTGSGPLKHGDVLISNYNNSMNLQGTGTTIVRIPASGAKPTLFFHGKSGLGLSTALGTLQYGFVVVGNAPTLDGTSATAGAGSLLVINSQGKLIQTITDPSIQSPWDMTLVDRGDQATAFVSNALTGAVSRLNFSVSSSGLKLEAARVIASGYIHRGDPVTLFVAPTGLVFDSSRDVLYVASSGDNAVYAVPNAAARKADDGQGTIIYQDDLHLHGALGLAAAPNGHLLVTNSDGINPDAKRPSEIVEFTKDGYFVKEIPVDPAEGGSFGLAVYISDDHAILAAVDDNTSTVLIWTLDIE